jgi:hypothetical protein
MTPAPSRPHVVSRRPPKHTEPRAKLRSLDVSALHVETHVDPRCIRRWAAGDGVRASAALALARACAKMGIEVRGT